MKNERILSYQLSKKISKDELQGVSAAGQTNMWTANGTYQNGAWDGCIDVNIDMQRQSGREVMCYMKNAATV